MSFQKLIHKKETLSELGNCKIIQRKKEIKTGLGIPRMLALVMAKLWERVGNATKLSLSNTQLQTLFKEPGCYKASVYHKIPTWRCISLLDSFFITVTVFIVVI